MHVSCLLLIGLALWQVKAPSNAKAIIHADPGEFGDLWLDQRPLWHTAARTWCDNHDGTGSGSLVVSGQPRRIEAPARTSPLEALADRATTLANQVNADSGEALLRYHEKMQAATTHEQLNDAWRDFEAEQSDRKFDGRVSNHLRNLGAAMREVLSGT